MYRIDVSTDDALALIASIAEHLPVGWSLGRIRIVGNETVLVDIGTRTTAALGIDENGVWRLAELPCGAQELTRWRNGVEVGRSVHRE